MRVAGIDELTTAAAGRRLAWETGDDAAWRESLRAHLAAAGSVLRRSLLDRVLRWHGAEGAEARERLDALLDGLDAVGDAWVGDGGTVGATPPRAARIRGSSTVLLVGSAPTTAFSAALRDEVVRGGRIRRATLSGHDAEALDAAMSSLGGRVVDADVWAGLDRAPASLDAWRDELSARRGEDAMPEGEAEVFVSAPRSRWRRDAALEGAPRLERFRQPGGWFRFVWRGAEGAVALTADEATRTALALESEAGHARRVVAEASGEGTVAFAVPGWIPRAEYRYLLGSCDRLGDGEGASRYTAARDVWPTLATMLRDRLGMTVDEALDGARGT
ncbi:MAG: hypothetical protein U0324_37145 [Polyangiales bacterium]